MNIVDDPEAVKLEQNTDDDEFGIMEMDDRGAQTPDRPPYPVTSDDTATEAVRGPWAHVDHGQLPFEHFVAESVLDTQADSSKLRCRQRSELFHDIRVSPRGCTVDT